MNENFKIDEALLAEDFGEDHDVVKPLERVTGTTFIYGGLNLVYGVEGAGKSHQLVKLLSKVAKTNYVIYFDTDGANGKNFVNHCRSNNVHYMKQETIIPYLKDETSTLLDASLRAIETLIKRKRGKNPDSKIVIVLDSFMSMAGGQEINNAEKVAPILYKLNHHAEKLDYCLIVVDHATKTFSKDGKVHGFKLEGNEQGKLRTTVTASKYTPFSYSNPQKGGTFELVRTRGDRDGSETLIEVKGVETNTQPVNKKDRLVEWLKSKKPKWLEEGMTQRELTRATQTSKWVKESIGELFTKSKVGKATVYAPITADTEMTTEEVVKPVTTTDTTITTPIATEVSTKPVEVAEKTVKVSLKVFKNQKGEWLTFDTPKESKEYRQRNSRSGFTNHNVKFADYARIVANTTSYSPYHFKGGDRSMANVTGTTNVLILDIDKGNMDIYTMHELLGNYKHIIATTSNNTNHFKYRLILQLDRDIELNSVQWKKFYKSVADTIGIEVDTNINKAGMFFGYNDSEVIVNLDGELFPTKLHVINAYEETEVIEAVEKIKDSNEQNIQWDNRYELFEWAYECVKNRSITLYSAMRNACERGWSKELVKELIWEINSELLRPLESSRVQVTIVNQIQKFI